MKRLCVAAFFLITASGIFAQDVSFFDGTWEEVLAKAQTEQKFIFVDAYTTWCGPCKMMDKQMFHGNAEVADLINTQCIAFRNDCEKGRGADFAMKFKIRAYPTILIFNPEGQLVARTIGYNDNQEEFVKMIHDALHVKAKQVVAYDARDLNVKFPDFYRNAFRKDDHAATYPKQEEVISFLDAQTDKFSEISWAVMSVFNLPGNYRQYFIDHYDQYRALYPIEVENIMEDIIYDKVMQMDSTLSDDAYQSILNMIGNNIASDKENLILFVKTNYYGSKGDWKSYLDTYQDYFDVHGYDQESVNEVAWTVFQQCPDSACIRRTTAWLDGMKDDLHDYYIMDTYASLLFKSGRMQEALDWAQKAIDEGTKEKADVSSTEALRASIEKAMK